MKTRLPAKPPLVRGPQIAPEMRARLTGPGGPYGPHMAAPKQQRPLGGSPGVTPMPSPGMSKPTQMPEMRTSPAPLTQAQMMQMMKSGGEVKREVDSLASRYPKKGIDPTIPAGVREKLVEQEREKMFKAGEKAHSERTLAKGGMTKSYAKGGVTRADGCAQRGKTKGRMV